MRVQNLLVFSFLKSQFYYFKDYPCNKHYWKINPHVKYERMYNTICLSPRRKAVKVTKGQSSNTKNLYYASESVSYPMRIFRNAVLYIGGALNYIGPKYEILFVSQWSSVNSL